jgi:hypothetical protein
VSRKVKEASWESSTQGEALGLGVGLCRACGVEGSITGLGEVKSKFFWESLLIWVFEIARRAREAGYRMREARAGRVLWDSKGDWYLNTNVER